ncbi:MAG: MFS transporter [Sedimentisphaerales bacterium]|nr:MFS transporter [Sedimentisphaerales bacterium]
MRQLFKDRNFIKLCLATLFLSSCLQLIWVVMPFIVKFIGGSDTDVGLCFMGQMGVYVIFCTLAGIMIDRFRPKRILVLGAAAEVFVAAGLLATVLYGDKDVMFLSPVMRLVFLMSANGIITAFFWPVMMGWISTGYEGAELTKRFGFYNVTWGMANMVFPIIGGYLMEINYFLPLVLAGSMAVLCLVTVCLVKCISESLEPPKRSDSTIVSQEMYRQSRQFLWMSRAALFSTFICMGVFRSHLGIFYKFQLGFSESSYGWAISLMCLFNVTVFWMMARSHYWHHNKYLFAITQSSILICILMIIMSSGLMFQLLAAGMVGIGYGVVYSSHQYYGVSGGRRRSGLMAIHETLIGAGISIGSLIGGMLSDRFGRYSPYWFIFAVIIAGWVVQVILWFCIGRNKRLEVIKKQ